MHDMNSGYHGYSMSKRAFEAYADGEKPLSRWQKKDIIAAVGSFAEKKGLSFSMEKFRKLNLNTLRSFALVYSSWHHTASFANKTEFYALNEGWLENLTDSGIDSILKEQAEQKKGKPEKPESETFRGEIHYLEWSGSRRHPRSKEIVLKDVNIEQRGSFYYVTGDCGREILRKKVDSRGTTCVKTVL